MILSKKHRNKLMNLVRYQGILSVEQKKFLCNKGETNFDIIKNMLHEGILTKPKEVWGALRILTFLRYFNRKDDFLNVVYKFILDEDISIRSYCSTLLQMISTLTLEDLSREFEKSFIIEKIFPVLRQAKEKGINSDINELVDKLLLLGDTCDSPFVEPGVKCTESGGNDD